VDSPITQPDGWIKARLSRLLVLAGGAEDGGLVLSYSFILKTSIMKKIFGLLLTGLFAVTVQAQTSARIPLRHTSAIGADKAAVRATRDLWNRVGDQKNEQWFKLPQGYMAEYTDGPIKAKYMYDQRGSWRYSLLTYTERQLPEEIRRLVRSTYYDFSIGWVKQVNEDEALVYVVHIEDDKSWKDLAVQDGEIRVLKEFRKI
jgi:hypothetical protein